MLFDADQTPDEIAAMIREEFEGRELYESLEEPEEWDDPPS